MERPFQNNLAITQADWLLIDFGIGKHNKHLEDFLQGLIRGGFW